jgi:hypothetical protein
MSHARSCCITLSLAAGLLGGTGLPAVAQDPVDIVYEYTSQDGTQAGSITIREITDPFTPTASVGSPLPSAAGASPSAEAALPPDQRYVGLTVRFEAAQDKRLDAEPSNLRIEDAEGYVYLPTEIPRPPDALPPDLADQPLQPGDRVSGLVGFALPKEAVIDEILYSPTPPEDPTITYRPESGATLLTIMDTLPLEVPALGTPVSDTSPDGTLAGTVTVRGITDPFVPFVSVGSPAPDGAVASPPGDDPSRPDVRYVLVDVVFEAAPDKRFQAAPWFIVLHDKQGNQWGYETLALPPDASIGEVANRLLGPEDRISGVVGFAVPRSAVIDRVLYEPPYAVRRVPLAKVRPTE